MKPVAAKKKNKKRSPMGSPDSGGRSVFVADRSARVVFGTNNLLVPKMTIGKTKTRSSLSARLRRGVKRVKRITEEEKARGVMRIAEEEAESQPRSGMRIAQEEIEEQPRFTPRMAVAEATEEEPRGMTRVAQIEPREQPRGMTRMAEEEATKDENFLCTTLCDWLAGLPLSYVTRSMKVHAGLSRCCQADSEEDLIYDQSTRGTYFIDLRGRFIRFAKYMLLVTLQRRCDPPTEGFLKVRVGCKEHGSGEGVLKQAIIDMLKEGQSINYNIEDSIISIKLDNRENYHSLVEHFNDCVRTVYEADDEDDGEEFLYLGSPFGSLDSDGSSVSDKESGSFSSYKDSDSCDDGLSPSNDPIFNKDYWASHGVKVRKREAAIWAKMKKYEETFLCTIACDLMFDFPKPRNLRVSKNMHGKIMAGLEKCYGDDRRKYIGDNFVDLRGLYVEEATELLVEHLDCPSNQAGGYLNVIVGCVIHGVGDGKLRRGVVKMLKLEKTELESTGSIISVKLNRRKNYGYLRKKFLDKFLPYCVDNEPMSLQEDAIATTSVVSGIEGMVALMAKEDGDGFTISCDLLSGLRRPLNLYGDSKMTGKVLAELVKCYGGDSNMVKEGNQKVTLSGKSIVDVLKLLILHLDSWSRPVAPGYLDSIVGCRLYGFGEGKLKQTILALLKLANTTWEEKDGGSSIFIELDGKKYYTCAGRDLVTGIQACPAVCPEFNIFNETKKQKGKKRRVG